MFLLWFTGIIIAIILVIKIWQMVFVLIGLLLLYAFFQIFFMGRKVITMGHYKPVVLYAKKEVRCKYCFKKNKRTDDHCFYCGADIWSKKQPS